MTKTLWDIIFQLQNEFFSRRKLKEKRIDDNLARELLLKGLRSFFFIRFKIFAKEILLSFGKNVLYTFWVTLLKFLPTNNIIIIVKHLLSTHKVHIIY